MYERNSQENEREGGAVTESATLKPQHCETPMDTTVPPTMENVFLPAGEEEVGKVDILVAEDSEVNWMLFDEILSTSGYSYKIVSNGSRALDCFEECRPRLVLSDISMPIVDGFQLTEEIRMRELGSMRRTPVVGITAHASGAETASWLQVGMDDFLPKPVSKDALLNKVQNWLEKERVSEVA